MQVEERIQVVRVLVIGLDRAGKSTLISQLLNLPVDEEMPTEGSKLSMAEIGQKAYSIWEGKVNAIYLTTQMNLQCKGSERKPNATSFFNYFEQLSFT